MKINVLVLPMLVDVLLQGANVDLGNLLGKCPRKAKSIFTSVFANLSLVYTCKSPFALGHG